MDVSPVCTRFFKSSSSESRIFFPFEYVSVDTPAVSTNFARTSILFSGSTACDEFVATDFL